MCLTLELELAYLAGFFDGEGSVMIKHNGPSATKKNGVGVVVVSVAQTSDWPLLRFQARFGGKIYAPKPKANQCRWLVWRCTARTAKNFLETLLPYLRLKRDQAEVALAFQATVVHPGGRRSVADNVVQFRVGCIEKVKQLNKRGKEAEMKIIGDTPYAVGG